MRLFIAVNLSPEMKNALTDAQRTMYDRGVRGRFTPEENLHLTLAFIGEYPSADAVMDALSTVTFTPFEIRLDGVGRFGDLWWAGLRESAALTAVVRRVRTIAPKTMTVRAISLMSSRRGRNGMIYTEVGTIEADSK